jgi:hypothetical protein
MKERIPLVDVVKEAFQLKQEYPNLRVDQAIAKARFNVVLINSSRHWFEHQEENKELNKVAAELANSEPVKRATQKIKIANNQMIRKSGEVIEGAV